MLDRLFARQVSLDTALAALTRYPFPPDTITRLQNYLTSAPPADLSRIRAEDLMARIGLDEQTTLELLATAVHEGLLDLHWDVYCPACQGNGATWDSLQQAVEAAACPHCQSTFDVHADDEIAVRFSLNPRYGRGRIRRQPPPTFRADASRISGLDLLNVQAFRDLLTQQVLPSHESLRVSRVAILFTDLRGSTALYAQKGDPRAYRLVREHFDVLFTAVRAERGVVVKTIGDSVMASFVAPASALRAALAMQRGLTAFNRRNTLTGDEALLLKLGLHAGPCIAVTMNGRVDYFGSAVNIASRVEGLATGGDVILTDAVRDDPDAAKVLAETTGAGGELVSSTARLRGLAEPVAVHRLTLPAAQPAIQFAAGPLAALPVPVP
jgi:class 3 adenylate cyclase